MDKSYFQCSISFHLNFRQQFAEVARDQLVVTELWVSVAILLRVGNSEGTVEVLLPLVVVVMACYTPAVVAFADTMVAYTTDSDCVRLFVNSHLFLSGLLFDPYYIHPLCYCIALDIPSSSHLASVPPCTAVLLGTVVPQVVTHLRYLY